MSAWEPGDVALVTRDDGSTTRAIWTRFGYGWQCVEGGPPIVDARRLVVVDQEDAEQVNRLRLAVGKLGSFTSSDVIVRETQAALREFANPTPRIEEPTGLGAVVEDDRGCRWVKVDTAMSCDSWTEADAGMSSNPWRKFASLDAVRILTEGVPR